MGKRVSNKRGKRGSRSNRIRIGFWRQRNITMLREQQKGMQKDLMKTPKAKEKNEILRAIQYTTKQIRGLIPKDILRRHQSR